METVIKLLNSHGDKKIGNHRRMEKRGVVNFLYFDKPVVIINRKTRTITVNNWKNEVKGTNRVIESYLNSSCITYLLSTANKYTLVDRRV